MARKVISTPSTQFDASSAAHAKALLANADILAGDATSKAIMLLYGMIDDLIGNDTASNTAIALNTAKTGITSGQTSAITANTAKTGITSGQTSAITANTAKTGISTVQARTVNNLHYEGGALIPTRTEGHTVSLSVTNNRGNYALVFTMVDSSGRTPVTKTATIALG